MGKGLSQLQRQIIEVARRNKGHVTNQMVLAQKLVPHAKIMRNGHLICNPGRFTSDQEHYRSMSQSVSRSLDRLVQRGLLRRQIYSPWGFVLVEMDDISNSFNRYESVTCETDETGNKGMSKKSSPISEEIGEGHHK